MAANASLVRPLALVGAKLTTCLTETFAAVPQKRPHTSDTKSPVKPVKLRTIWAMTLKFCTKPSRVFVASGAGPALPRLSTFVGS